MNVPIFCVYLRLEWLGNTTFTSSYLLVMINHFLMWWFLFSPRGQFIKGPFTPTVANPWDLQIFKCLLICWVCNSFTFWLYFTILSLLNKLKIFLQLYWPFLSRCLSASTRAFLKYLFFMKLLTSWFLF